ncbi:MAG: phage holin family protein [Verrucomicrobiae bacterium]|nr:phage holin family protein [Verrucomicrobiae bacterium]
MPFQARHFLLRWGITALAVLVATQIVPGLECRSWTGLAVAALLLGFLNAFVRPLLTLLSLPLVVLTLGLFLWVINAALLAFVGWLVKPFLVASFWSALGGAAVISIVTWLVGGVLGLDASDRRPPPPRRRGPPGSGPVIDV